MIFIRRLRYLGVLAVLCSLALAQSPAPQSGEQSNEDKRKAQEELQKKALVLLDEVIKQASGLRAPQNRALIQAHAANLLWKFDEKTARAIFRAVTDEMAQAINSLVSDGEMDKAQPEDPQSFMFPRQLLMM